VTATKSEAENVASVVTFTAVYQDIPALSISWLSPFPSVTFSVWRGCHLFRLAVTFSVRPFQATSVPEPATLTLTAIGAFGLLFYRWRRPARAVAPPGARESGTC
jgi:PEP-CTERM motif